TINPNQARFMISDAVSPNRVRLIYDEVVKVDKDEQRVQLENGEIQYEYLVIALGFKSNPFGIKGMEENAYSIVDIDSSRFIRDQLELQSAKHTAEHPDEDLTVRVRGAGLTGSGLLGELAERVPRLCKPDDVDRSQVKIITVDAMPPIFPMFDNELVA